MMHLHNFNEDFTLALDDYAAECAGVYQVSLVCHGSWPLPGKATSVINMKL
jgi:hypothetical protein